MQKLARSNQPPPRINVPAPKVDRLVCWDLDETMGQFYGLYARMNGHRYSRSDGIKPGIRKALEKLSALGLSHAVTTAAPKREAFEALEKSGLMAHFLHVFYDDLIMRDVQKDYSVVARHFGIPESERRKKIIAVGDIIQLDIHNGGVFIWEEHSPYHSALPSASLIAMLSEAGGGDFWAGFGVMFAGGAQLPNPDPEGGRKIHVAEGFEVALYYKNGNAVARVRVEDAFRESLEPL